MEEGLLLGLLKIIFINIILSGDNAVVIALACRRLPEDKRKKAVFLGSFGAIGLRVGLTFVAVWLLEIPYFQIIGGLLLLWIAIKLIKGEDEDGLHDGGSSMSQAIKTIIIADLVMSLDNVVAVAGAAQGNLVLIVIGLVISIPLIIWGSKALMTLMNRFPIIITLGAGLLGYTAGEMVMNDKSVSHFFETHFSLGDFIIPAILAIAVIVIGKLSNKGKTDASPKEITLGSEH
ncbi:MAG: TerC family protein [Paenibacillaceae bacterium]